MNFVQKRKKRKSAQNLQWFHNLASIFNSLIIPHAIGARLPMYYRFVIS